MPKVTKEVMKSLIDAGVYPPRHQQGCPKNFARTYPMILAALGGTVEEIKNRTLEVYNNSLCNCK